MNIEFNVDHQTLSKTSEEMISDYSNNYLSLSFTFTDDWTDSVKYVLFKTVDGVFQQRLIDDSCMVPTKVLEYNQCIISVYGIYRNTRITTNGVRLYLEKSNFTNDISSVDVEDVGDIVSEIFEMLELKADDADLSVVAKTGDYTDLNNLPNLSNVATSGDYNDLSNKPTVASLGADVQVLQLQTPNEGCIKSYQVLQGNERKGVYIDIPLIPFLKSAEVKTCVEDDVPPGFHVGDIYFDLVFNTEDEDRHEYVDLSKLIDVYDADNLTLQLVNGVFSVKNKGVGSAQLSDDVNLKLGYAEHYNSSVCKNITNNDILNWNNKQSTSNLVTSFGSTPSDTKYPSEKLVKDTIDNVIGTIDDWLTR